MHFLQKIWVRMDFQDILGTRTSKNLATKTESEFSRHSAKGMLQFQSLKLFNKTKN